MSIPPPQHRSDPAGEPRQFGQPIEIIDRPAAEVPQYQPKKIVPPEGVAENELFAFPGVDWLAFFRDSVVREARALLQNAATTIAPLDVEPGNFDQADSVRTYFANVKADTEHNLRTINAALVKLERTIDIQAEKYKSLKEATSATVEGLGSEFRWAGGLVDQLKPLSQTMPNPKA